MSGIGAGQSVWWWVPIVISIVALSVSVSTFVWQIIKHVYLDGGRVIVKLRPAIWEPETSLARFDSLDGAWRLRADVEQRRGAESAELVVENAGRTAVTISSPGIMYRGERVGRHLRRVRHAVSPRTFPEAASCEGQIQPDSRAVRLEPYARAIYLLDVHSVMAMARRHRQGTRTVVLRGSIDVAGRKRPALSPWRRRWRIPRAAVTLVEYADRWPAESAILLILLRQRDREGGHLSMLEFASRLIAARLWEHREVPDPTERVEMSVRDPETVLACGDIGLIMVKYELAELLRDHDGELTWEGAKLQLQLTRTAEKSRQLRSPGTE